MPAGLSDRRAVRERGLLALRPCAASQAARHPIVLRPCAVGSRHPAAAHLHAGVSFSAPNGSGLLLRRYPPRLLLGNSCRTASRAASDGLIWPKDGCASIACAAKAAPRLSSPGLRPFLASQESLSPAILRCATPRSGCAGDRLRPADRHRGRDGRGARTAKEK